MHRALTLFLLLAACNGSGDLAQPNPPPDWPTSNGPMIEQPDPLAPIVLPDTDTDTASAAADTATPPSGQPADEPTAAPLALPAGDDGSPDAAPSTETP